MIVVCALFTTGISTILGLARGALEHFIERAPKKGIAMTIHRSQAKVGHIQYKVGLAAMKVESAHLHINRSIDILENYVQRGELLNQEDFVRIQTDIGYAAMLCSEAVEIADGRKRRQRNSGFEQIIANIS
ncbi:hypothetical protein D3C74_223870 [compost metagenome]